MAAAWQPIVKVGGIKSVDEFQRTHLVQLSGNFDPAVVVLYLVVSGPHHKDGNPPIRNRNIGVLKYRKSSECRTWHEYLVRTPMCKRDVEPQIWITELLRYDVALKTEDGELVPIVELRRDYSASLPSAQNPNEPTLHHRLVLPLLCPRCGVYSHGGGGHPRAEFSRTLGMCRHCAEARKKVMPKDDDASDPDIEAQANNLPPPEYCVTCKMFAVLKGSDNQTYCMCCAFQKMLCGEDILFHYLANRAKRSVEDIARSKAECVHAYGADDVVNQRLVSSTAMYSDCQICKLPLRRFAFYCDTCDKCICLCCNTAGAHPTHHTQLVDLLTTPNPGYSRS